MPFGNGPSPLKLDGLEVARAFFAGCMSSDEPKAKRLWVAYLDPAAKCLHIRDFPYEQISGLPVRSILADASRYQAAGILLAHSRSNQVEAPMENEMQATRALAAAAEALDCTVVDHLVFAGRGWLSFRELGVL